MLLIPVLNQGSHNPDRAGEPARRPEGAHGPGPGPAAEAVREACDGYPAPLGPGRLPALRDRLLPVGGGEAFAGKLWPW